jgi:septal ring factor EnvC (AmiA/AmiB activator)
MRSIRALALVASFLAGVPAAAQPGLPLAVTTAGGQAAMLADVEKTFDQLEKNVDLEYAKLTQEVKKNIDALNAKIKEHEKKIEELKRTAEKIQIIEQKLGELLPKVVGAVGSDPDVGRRTAPSTGRRDQLAAQLASELAKAGMNLPADELHRISDAIGRGGQGGMAVALYLVISIAQTSAAEALRERGRGPSVGSLAAALAPASPNAPTASAVTAWAALQSLLATRDFPVMTQGDLFTGAALGPAAAPYFANLFHAQALDRLAATSAAIDAQKKAIKEVRQQILALETEIEKLQKNREKALAELREKKKQALAQALMAPTTAPKNP